MRSCSVIVSSAESTRQRDSEEAAIGARSGLCQVVETCMNMEMTVQSVKELKSKPDGDFT